MAETISIDALRVRLEEFQGNVESLKQQITKSRQVFKRQRADYKMTREISDACLMIAQGKVEALEWLIYDMEAETVVELHAH